MQSLSLLAGRTVKLGVRKQLIVSLDSAVSNTINAFISFLSFYCIMYLIMFGHVKSGNMKTHMQDTTECVNSIGMGCFLPIMRYSATDMIWN